MDVDISVIIAIVAVCVGGAVVLANLSGACGKAQGVATASRDAPRDAPRDVSAARSAALPRQVPVKVVYATTTGTAKRFAEKLRRDAFALNVSGYHFDVTLLEAPQLDIDALATQGILIFLLPTWTGGVPPASAEVMCFGIHDMATDFRVGRAELAALRYAVFGLGCAEYGAAWCKAARTLHEDLASMGAEPLVRVGTGDDSKDMDAQFAEWTSLLWPALCDVYTSTLAATAANATSSAAADAAAARGASAGGCGSKAGAGSCACGEAEEDACGSDCEDEDETAASGSAGGKAAASARWHGDRRGDTGKERLPLKDYRRLKRQQAEEAEAAARRAARIAAAAAAAAASTTSPAASAAPAAAPVRTAASAPTLGSDATPVDTPASVDDDSILTAEDRLNDRLLAEADADAAARVAEYVDSDDEAAGATSGAGASAGAAGASGSGGAGGEELVDVEDIGATLAAAKVAAADAARKGAEAAEMVTPAQRKALTKEGYRIIGTHSAVKLCRWTKAQLRGRGGCYKHTCYGITSYQCMEATPSLACANKCVFCWRHHKNPVGREWRWQTDEPAMIVEEAITKHQAMIKELKGMPGLKPERHEEGYTVRHCALSLVGEPIMYPRINDLIRELHTRHISTFLVTNAQFPECIAALQPVTQLYVSIDAATKETLRAIDRPLFKDFWERFLASLDALREKRQRTVYRLTLLKGHNMREIDDYVELIARGQPDLIEVKGVTYCGTSPGSNLTMKDVPWHHEVKAFCELLAERLGDGTYGLASEHAHSCCVLLAKNTLRVDGRWHTHIDYPRFHALMQRYYESEGKDTFTTQDYMAPTPDWALYNAPEGGFDPIEMRWRRNKDGSLAEIEYKSSESGCG